MRSSDREVSGRDSCECTCWVCTIIRHRIASPTKQERRATDCDVAETVLIINLLQTLSFTKTEEEEKWSRRIEKATNNQMERESSSAIALIPAGAWSSRTSLKGACSSVSGS